MRREIFDRIEVGLRHEDEQKIMEVLKKECPRLVKERFLLSPSGNMLYFGPNCSQQRYVIRLNEGKELLPM